MKEEKMLRAFSLVDDELVKNAAPKGQKPNKSPFLWKKLAYIAVAACLMLVIVLPIAFMGGDDGSVPVITSTFVGQTTQDAPTDPGDSPPDETQTPSTKRKSDLRPYENSPYYPLIEKLDAYYQQQALLDEYFGNYGGLPSETLGGAVTPDSPTVDMSQTVLPDFTDNQVEGVIEGDIVKRTETHIFAIQNDYLNVYDINGINSRMVGRYEITRGACQEMYLLDGGQTALLVIYSYKENYSDETTLVLLNTRLPANIQEIKRVTLDGDVRTSRVSEDSILLFARYGIKNAPDYGNPCEFVPCVTDESGTKPISFDDIILSDAVSGTYSVIYSLDSETLEVEGAKAFLGGMSAVYVSQNNIFVASYQYQTGEHGDDWKAVKKTLIRCFPYGNGSLEEKGCVTLDGYVKDQYSMDEKDGILRVVTTVEYASYYKDDDEIMRVVYDYTGASLYCVSLEDFETVASVEKFAPAGEKVQSVRFDGNYAYVCTSLSFTDPVFFFDLSDLSNITYTDTGVIEGYSSSLVDFGNGNLLGIGYGSNGSELKIEIYKEEGDSVVSVAQYRENCWFSYDYKSYYIDREHQLIGLCINRTRDDGDGLHYILLYFNGRALLKLVDYQTSGHYDSFRSVQTKYSANQPWEMFTLISTKQLTR